ncbi:MAG TPA: DUF3443 family protein, partial [Burkholderiaceae bacterium]|nr:DUF3443 family protein [Burkholderiaceae bacterium]
NTNCQTIDHVIVDSGSWGLRILSTVLKPALASALPVQTDSTPAKNTFVECTVFGDGIAWGPIKTVNLQMGGELAKNLPVQIIGDPNFPDVSIPSDCTKQAPPGTTTEDTVASFGGNGLIGIGVFAQDCGSGCATDPLNDEYFACTGSSCQSTAIPNAQQTTNPVTLFAKDNNGVIISLPAIAAGGATNVAGSLIFGVGTESNNALGSAGVYTYDPGSGLFSSSYNGQTGSQSLVDSGTNAILFNDNSIHLCSNGFFYCPATTLNLSGTIVSFNNVSAPVNFSISNSDAIFASGVTASAQLAGSYTGATGVDWGLPFFFGRNVGFVIQGSSVGTKTGPFVAF